MSNQFAVIRQGASLVSQPRKSKPVSQMMSLRLLTATLMMVVATGTSNAALFDRGNGFIYDSSLDITWLADANYARTSGFDDDGKITWSNATAWASSLTYGGYSDWRLPTAMNLDGSNPCSWWYCAGSEMGHLFYSDGALNANSSALTSPALTNFFVNMQAAVYWTSTGVPGRAWSFALRDGYQNMDPTSAEWYAWAVRDGDVSASPVPAPPAFILMLTGLGFLGLMKRLRASNNARRSRGQTELTPE